MTRKQFIVGITRNAKTVLSTCTVVKARIVTNDLESNGYQRVVRGRAGVREAWAMGLRYS